MIIRFYFQNEIGDTRYIEKIVKERKRKHETLFAHQPPKKQPRIRITPTSNHQKNLFKSFVQDLFTKKNLGKKHKKNQLFDSTWVVGEKISLLSQDRVFHPEKFSPHRCSRPRLRVWTWHTAPLESVPWDPEVMEQPGNQKHCDNFWPWKSWLVIIGTSWPCKMSISLCPI